MNEFIKSIEEVFNVKTKDSWSEKDGFLITTDQHSYNILIDNMQNCCENWGYMVSEDDPSDYIGAEVFNVELVDTALDKKQFNDEQLADGVEESVQFINFTTNRGTLQFAVYNAHNGYYGHEVYIAKDTEFLFNGTL